MNPFPQFQSVILYTGVCGLFHAFWSKYSIYLISNFSFLPTEKQNLWFNKAVSTCHAVLLYSLTVYYWLMLNNRFSMGYQHQDCFELLLIDLMIGYLIYDMLYEMYDALNTANLKTDILLHHILGFTAHIVTRFTLNKAAIFYTLIIYLAEFTTPFLNISWLCHQLNFQNSFFYKLCLTIGPPGYVVFRILLGPFVFFHMLYYSDQWQIYQDNDKQYRFQPFEFQLFFYGNLIIVVFFILLNVYWFLKIIQIAFGKRDRRDQ
jgi:hypothetical protein